MSSAQEIIEVTLFEDPACGWCWAFQPVLTAFRFEFLHEGSRNHLALRRVMGGLRDRPAGDPRYCRRQWRLAAQISGMPFEPSIWNRRPPRTTYDACRAVKAATILPGAREEASRLLRRLQEAFFVEGIPIDDREAILSLAADIGLSADLLREFLGNGRADLLFQQDRREARVISFGFPTLVISRPGNEAVKVLNGLVSYGDLAQAVCRFGFPQHLRRRFRDDPDDWVRLLGLDRRLTLAEIRHVSGLSGRNLEERLKALAVESNGSFVSLPASQGQRAAG